MATTTKQHSYLTIAEQSQSPPNTSEQQPVSHATTAAVARSMNYSGIGELLDHVFLGEPVGSSQPSINFKVAFL